MVDSIKITALQDIGANIAYTTLVPVVNMAGTPTTQKANLQILGNLILSGAGGSYFPRAAQANLALSVANAAQPNITSVGTLTTLNVSGNVTAGNIGNVNLVSANFFSGDGSGLTNLNIPGLGNISSINLNGNGSTVLYGNGFWGAASFMYSNSNVANYLPTYTGTVGGNRFLSPGAATVSANGTFWFFNTNGDLSWPAPPGGDWHIGADGPGGSEFTLHSHSNIAIATNVLDSTQLFVFDTEGTFTAPGNVNLVGPVITVGPGANVLAETLTNPTIVISNDSSSYVQAAINNVSDIGSADWAAYGHHGNDESGWSDMGFTSSAFNDPNYTITGPGDGYFFVQGYQVGQAPFVGGGNLVLATGTEGEVKDIIFATGGFSSSDEFARFDHANNKFHLTRTGSAIKFQDGTVQNTAGVVWTTAPVSNTSAGTAGQAAYDTGGNLFVCVATNTWAKFAGTTSW